MVGMMASRPHHRTLLPITTNTPDNHTVATTHLLIRKHRKAPTKWRLALPPAVLLEMALRNTLQQHQAIRAVVRLVTPRITKDVVIPQVGQAHSTTTLLHIAIIKKWEVRIKDPLNSSMNVVTVARGS